MKQRRRWHTTRKCGGSVCEFGFLPLLQLADHGGEKSENGGKVRAWTSQAVGCTIVFQMLSRSTT